GEVDDLKYAAAAGAINFGFPVIADTVIPEILPTGITTYEHVVRMPCDEIEGKDDLDRATKLVQKCIQVRGVKIKITDVPVPIPYGSAFEGEVVRRADMRVEFGGKNSRSFEYLYMTEMENITDGKIEVIGPDFDDLEDGASMDMGVVVQVAGREMEMDFEPVLERQIHDFVNGASGIQHIGQRDIVWCRIAKSAAEKGFNLEHFGKIIHARLHSDFGAVLDKVQVTIYTKQKDIETWLENAREAYDYRNKRLADMTDISVEEFYSCTLCQSFAPDHVCVVSPERLGLCGAYNWLDCKASFSIDPTGPNQPIQVGECYDEEIGYWKGTIDYTKSASHGVIEKVSMYSIMENPMTACGCFEAILMYIPEVEGVIVVSREDTGMTPMGMKFSTLAGMAGGGVQTPGVMGVGKYYMLSPKFISADGGFKRVVWMSKNIKDSMMGELQAVAEREGIPDLLDKIADSELVTTVEELQEWVKSKNHPVLEMPTMQREEKELDIPEDVKASDGVIAQAEAVISKTTPDASEPTPEPEAATKPAAPIPGGIMDDRADRAVDNARKALMAALAELDGIQGIEGFQSSGIPAAPASQAAAAAKAPAVEIKADQSWLPADTETPLVKESWDGVVREITLGATAADGGTRSHTVTVGGSTAMPFMHFEGKTPFKPVLAIEIMNRRPDDWSDLLVKVWGDVMDDPGEWAKAAEKAGAEVLYLKLALIDEDGNPTTKEQAVEAVGKVLKASGLPLIIFGPGQPEPDNELLIEISTKFKGERLLLGVCEDKNYRTIVASAMADGQLVVARTAMDVNLAKQLNILITDMGLTPENIVMDPTTGALGYGFEYGYSVMERLRIAALQGDSMTQFPMMVTPGEECWKTKESKVGVDVPESWGDWETRAIAWESTTAIMLAESCADLIVLRHPESVRRTKEAIDDLMSSK
ncbi:MAG: CO dehydrogenase/CO-methylating acetyl-CoA synthase complex subunit beta, partial [Anaerolineales bacterium]